MNTKYLNLLPKNYRFELKKYIFIKAMTIFFILNMLVLISFFVLDRIKISKLNGQIVQEKEKIKKISSLNSSFETFKIEKTKLENIVSSLNISEKLYYDLKRSPNSAFLDMIKTFNVTSEGIFLKNISYSDGVVNISGVAKTAKDFYKYYKILEEDPMIADKLFSNLSKNEEGLYNFTLTLKFRGLDG
ncbi:MAG: PilN domain-containing protein [Calditerrivibrio sp.]|nr:PilN domain-containing protein [Calditerrivibrio sp.]MCA1980569.1 PilN domain-containing protein [Calditerrivibrio sp.]